MSISENHNGQYAKFRRYIMDCETFSIGEEQPLVGNVKSTLLKQLGNAFLKKEKVEVQD